MKLLFLLLLIFCVPAQAQEIQQIQVRIKTGVLGLDTNKDTGKVVRVFPESDFYGKLHTGDSVLQIDGHDYSYISIQMYGSGEPGSVACLLIRKWRDNSLVFVRAKRKPVSDFVQYGDYYRELSK